jgi:hypothetical protein
MNLRKKRKAGRQRVLCAKLSSILDDEKGCLLYALHFYFRVNIILCPISKHILLYVLSAAKTLPPLVLIAILQ